VQGSAQVDCRVTAEVAHGKGSSLNAMPALYPEGSVLMEEYNAKKGKLMLVDAQACPFYRQYAAAFCDEKRRGWLRANPGFLPTDFPWSDYQRECHESILLAAAKITGISSLYSKPTVWR
jgi:hypothetical protein